MIDNNNAIEIRNMTKWFKVQYDGAHTLKEKLLRGSGKSERHVVLSDINLDIKKGETVALIGVNGSGKSTLLKLMTKIIYPNKGTVETNGKLTSLLELGAGFHQDFTGRENIYFNAAIFGLTEKEINERLNDIIEFSELGAAIDEPVRTYSSGMYMRLAFSVAINVDADILLIDEILAVGDKHFQDKCFAKLEELRDSDKTIIIVSHSMDMTNRLCERSIWICDTKVRLDGKPEEVGETYMAYLEYEHSSIKAAKIKSGELRASGSITFDFPKTNTSYGLTDTVLVRGWKICDDRNAKFVITLNGKEINSISYAPRPDVETIFREDYGGLYDPNEVGFKCDLKLGDYVDNTCKTILFEAKLISEKNDEIAEKSTTVYVKKED